MEGIPQADDAGDSTDAKPFEEGVRNLSIGDQNWTPDVSQISEKADMLVAYSTVPGDS